MALAEIAEESKRSAYLDAGRQTIADEDAFAVLEALRVSVRDGEVGTEGFRTVLLLGRADVDTLQNTPGSATLHLRYPHGLPHCQLSHLAA